MAAGELVALLVTLTLPVTLPVTPGANNTFSVTDWLGVKMVLALTPLALKPAPVTVTPEMVTLEFPLLVSVTGNPLLPPTFTLPKLRLVGLAPSKNVATTPVPLKARVRGEPGALLVMETLPLALPAAEGANCALNVVFCPAASVSGTDKPAMLKPVPKALAAEIVTLAVPELLNVMVCVPLLPTSTFPKLKLEGFAVSAPCTPDPLRATLAGELGASLVIVSVPDALPVAVGAKVTVKELLAPGLILRGKLAPLTLKAAPATES